MKFYKKHHHLISAYIVAFIAVLATLLPIIWVGMLSLKSKGQTFTRPPKWFFEPTISNYAKIWENDLFTDTFINSIIITIFAIILSITIALFAAFALKRYNIRFKGAFMQWLIIAYMLPEFLFIIPMYSIYQTLGLYDAHIGLALMYQVHVLPFSIWMLRSFLDEVPKEIDDAATMDGCSSFETLYKIYLPLILPGITATAILNAIWIWNELTIALGLTFSNSQPITLGIASFRGYISIDWGGMTTGSIIAIVPMVIFALLAQKHIVKGLTLGSVKG